MPIHRAGFLPSSVSARVRSDPQILHLGRPRPAQRHARHARGAAHPITGLVRLGCFSSWPSLTVFCMDFQVPVMLWFEYPKETGG